MCESVACNSLATLAYRQPVGPLHYLVADDPPLPRTPRTPPPTDAAALPQHLRTGPVHGEHHAELVCVCGGWGGVGGVGVSGAMGAWMLWGAGWIKGKEGLLQGLGFRGLGGLGGPGCVRGVWGAGWVGVSYVGG